MITIEYYIVDSSFAESGNKTLFSFLGTLEGGGETTLYEPTTIKFIPTNSNVEFNHWESLGYISQTSYSPEFTIDKSEMVDGQTYTFRCVVDTYFKVTCESADPTKGEVEEQEHKLSFKEITYEGYCNVDCSPLAGYMFNYWNVVLPEASYLRPRFERQYNNKHLRFHLLTEDFGADRTYKYEWWIRSGGNLVLTAHFIEDTAKCVDVYFDREVGGEILGNHYYNVGDECTLEWNNGFSHEYRTLSFNAWFVDEETSYDNPYTFTITEDHGSTINVSLMLISIGITITVKPNDYAYGRTTGGGSYIMGETVNLTATPSTYCKFVKWTKDGKDFSTERNVSVQVMESATYIAYFAKDPIEVYIRHNNNWVLAENVYTKTWPDGWVKTDVWYRKPNKWV